MPDTFIGTLAYRIDESPGSSRIFLNDSERFMEATTGRISGLNRLTALYAVVQTIRRLGDLGAVNFTWDPSNSPIAPDSHFVEEESGISVSGAFTFASVG